MLAKLFWQRELLKPLLDGEHHRGMRQGHKWGGKLQLKFKIKLENLVFSLCPLSNSLMPYFKKSVLLLNMDLQHLFSKPLPLHSFFFLQRKTTPLWKLEFYTENREHWGSKERQMSTTPRFFCSFFFKSFSLPTVGTKPLSLLLMFWSSYMF